MIFIDLDEHGHFAVNHHRTNGRNIELPVIGKLFGFGEGEVMAGGQKLNLFLFTFTRGAHDANGNVDVICPFIVVG